ncbi:hypothetical protein B0H16DRAFT_1751494 [Mycena metata]|uniref:CCHC-type domain-containing protein n=1 Tax=Mycena metata TaxID=1033252 RepID=A0AAD7GKM9_9AGAR|nr:hypothetical protein B0H16DRAFT_1751494 [Mycena metata]
MLPCYACTDITTEQLYERVNEHEEALVEVFNRGTGNTLTLQNLPSTLRRLGFTQTPSATTQPGRQANLATTANEDTNELDEIPVETSEPPLPETDVTIWQVYQTLKRKQRPPPPGGYPFSRNDHVTTKMGKAPLSPCKVCGSPNHWDKECPDWNVYIEHQKRGTLLVATNSAAEESEMLYHSAYSVLLESRLPQGSF